MLTGNRLLTLFGRTLLIGLLLIGQLLVFVPAQPAPTQRAQQTLAAGQQTTGPGTGQSGQATTLTGGTQTYAARFDTDLFVQEPIQLRGVAAGTTINFIRPRGWSIQQGTELRLQMSHSEALIPELSYLNISINNTVLKTVILDKSNVLTTTIPVPIPPELLQDYNVLQLSVAQHYTRDCEDPFNPSLWTRINKESEIYFVYTPTPQKPDLSLFPAPFYDDLHYGPTQLQYLMPQPSTNLTQTLKAMATINTALAQAVAWHPMETSFISSLDEAKYPVVVVGTPAEQPRLGELTAGAPISGPFVQVMQHPKNPLIPVLIISGNNGENVVKAARALSQPTERKALNGESASLINFKEADPAASHAWPAGYIPDKTEFTLADMGYKEQSVEGFFSSPIIMDFRSLPDYKFLERNQSMTVHYYYSGQLNTDLSQMEVKIDDIVIFTQPLTKREGEERRDTFSFPSGLVHPNAKLRVQFHLYPIGYDPCKRIEDEQIKATLYADSSFSMPRDKIIYLPDLEAFRYGGFPFTRYQDMQDVTIVLPREPNPNDMQMLMNVTTRLGRMTKSQRIGLEVATGEVSQETKEKHNLIVIGTPDRQPLIKQLADDNKSTFSILGDNQKQLRSVQGDPLLTATEFNNQGVIEEVVSPWGTSTSWGTQSGKNVILIITGRTDQAMMNAGKVLIDDKLFYGDRVNNKDLRGIEGNLLLVEDSGRYNAIFSPGAFKETQVGYVPWYRGIQLWAARNWLITLAIVFLILFIAFLIFRAALVRYRNRESAEPVRFTS